MRWHIACTFCSVDISAYVCAHARLFFEVLREEHVQVLHIASSGLPGLLSKVQWCKQDFVEMARRFFQVFA